MVSFIAATLENVSVDTLENTTENVSRTNPPEIVQLTTYELWTQLIFFYGLLAGVVSTILSILVWVGILKEKKLRTRFFVIVAWLTFCRTFICVQFFVLSIHRTLRTLNVVQIDQKRIVCHALHFWLLDGWSVEMCLLCTLVIDRVMAIMASNYYKNLTSTSAFYFCLIETIVVSFIKLVPSYTIDNMLENAKCINLYSFLNPTFNTFSQSFDLLVLAIVLILYFFLIYNVHSKIAKTQNSNDESTNATKIQLRRQLKLMPILRNLVFMHCGLSFSSKLLLLLSSVVGLEHTQRMTAYGGAFGCVDVFANVFVLLVTNSEIRQAALRRWCKKATVNKVNIIQGSPKSNVVNSRFQDGSRVREG